MNDKILRQKIIDQLDFDPSIDSAGIGVAVHGGVVTLSGHVPTYIQKHQAESVTKAIKGVRGIAQEIEVQYDGLDVTTDEEIAKRALAAMAFNVMLPAEGLQVRVSKGWVTLSGEVEWQYQRHVAEADVRKLRGVVGITNSITLKACAVAADVEKRIKDALGRDAALDAQAIHVKVAGDKVTLDGTVDCWRDRDLVERAAWAAPGVRTVEDHLRVA
ncbi:MAG TPA: BON domain-containing protein [Caulobacteraceae bacterium]|nr:BON domain-containing protein [Caulobacteraceae bacterium]